MNPTARIVRLTLIAVFLAASAFGSAVPGTTKVVVPIGTHLSEQDFAGVGAARLQDYEAFRVYRVPSAALAKLQADAAAVGEAIEVHDEWDTVLFRNRSIDTRAADAGKIALDPAGTNALQMTSATDSAGSNGLFKFRSIGDRKCSGTRAFGYSGAVGLGRADTNHVFCRGRKSVRPMPPPLRGRMSRQVFRPVPLWCATSI